MSCGGMQAADRRSRDRTVSSGGVAGPGTGGERNATALPRHKPASQGGGHRSPGLSIASSEPPTSGSSLRLGAPPYIRLPPIGAPLTSVVPPFEPLTSGIAVSPSPLRFPHSPRGNKTEAEPAT